MNDARLELVAGVFVDARRSPVKFAHPESPQRNPTQSTPNPM